MPTELLEQPDSLEKDTQQPIAKIAPETYIEAERNQETQVDIEAELIKPAENQHSIEDFEQLIGQPLPEEIKQQIHDLKQEKLRALTEQIDGLTALREHLEAKPCSDWIKSGKLVTPSLAEAVAPGLKQVLEQRLEAFLQTPEGKAVQKDRQLEAFATNPQPTIYEVAEAAKLLGLATSKVKLKLMPGHHKKIATDVKAKIDEHFRSYDDELDDFPEVSNRRSPGEEKDLERQRAATEISALVHQPRQRFGEEINESRLFGRYSEEQDPAQVPVKLAQLDQAKTRHVHEMLQAAGTIPLEKTLTALARGRLSVDESVALLREAEGPQVEQDLYSMIRHFKARTKAKLWESLPEPSLVGLDISEADIDLVGQGLDKLIEISTLLGQKPENKDSSLTILREQITENQEQFFAGIGSENDMYWHFSPFGLRIFKSKQLSPSTVTGNVMTGSHSKSIHFIKPGIIGMDSVVDYTGYAQSGVRNGFMGNRRIADAFGVAVIYPLGNLAEAMPYRDEPANQDHTSSDTVFRESEGLPEKSLPLEEAYILPMQTYEQIRTLADHPDFKDLFSPTWQSREELALAVTKRAAAKAGFSQEWIEGHVLSPIAFGKTTTLSAKDVYQPVSQQIRSRLPSSRTLIVPLSAKPGGFETHDVNGGEIKSAGWHEKLIKLETLRRTEAPIST